MRHSLFGFPLFLAKGWSALLFEIDQLIQSSEFDIVTTLNAEMVVAARQNPTFSRLISRSSLIIPDGRGIALASLLRTRKMIHVYPGIELVQRLIEAGHYRFYWVGAKPDVLERAVQICTRRFPNLQILGRRDGYFKSNQAEVIIQDIQTLKPDIVLVGLGSPKQEKFLAKLKKSAQYGVGIGVGGSFDIIAGVKKRAPKGMQVAGLEWFYRGIIEPKRIPRWRFLGPFLKMLLFG